MSSSDEKKRPFLYIHQPYIEVNEVNNQEVYISKGKRQRMTEDIPENKTEIEQTKPKKAKSYSIPPLSAIDDTDPHEVKRVEMEQKDLVEIKEVRPKFNRRRPFKELSIREKIAYIENYPSQLPPVSCFYKLPDRTLQGKLVRVSDSHLELTQENGDKQVIEIEEILEIRLPGLG